MNPFLESIYFRHACKLFDKSKKIPREIFDEILEVGRLAPSSFGMEPTRLIVVRSDKAKQELYPLCWEQPQITTASEVVVFKSLQSDLIPPSEYVKNNTRRRKMDLATYEVFCNRYGGYLKARGFVDDKIAYWSALQAYIMATYMVGYASYLKIDTCFIEGFDKRKVEQLYGLDTFKEQVSLIVCFGYRAKAQQPRFRIGIDELVEYK
ncbi:NAD(P)H-dependent oxidoreductase [Helicobacter jaachi]|uniref:NAD(P)H-dependent oxidoreductase n=1 Tax=Helicobacter jaachi TaxID=1677920 RepID=A0A4U8TCV5_9HELI|nr:NAD(P)H-dependent oxidoreductase [Helicobacter jaachi]TLD97811.1 NAD(P)H-dependent oxidoreductase [Helicobacter jaachi]